MVHLTFRTDHVSLMFLSQFTHSQINDVNFLSGPQAPLMAPSSQSEDVLNVEQVALQEASLPPPVPRVMDPGWLTCPQL